MRWAILFICCVLAGLIVAMYAHGVFFAPHANRTDRPATGVGAGVPADDEPDTRPVDLLRLMRRSAPLDPVTQTPSDVPPPPGAVLRRSHTSGAMKQLRHHLRYDVRAGTDNVAEHFKGELPRLGYRLGNDKLHDRKRTLVFVRGDREVVVMTWDVGDGATAALTVDVTDRGRQH